MFFKLRDWLLTVAFFIMLIAALLFAGWLDGPEIEAHERWYAEQQTKVWCL
jgi:hypothetical protein